MSSRASSVQTARNLSPSRTAIVLVAASVVAIALNSVVAAVAGTVGFAPLTLPVYGAFTVVGVVVGWFGWRFVQRRTVRPARVLSILVPVVAVLSFVPDLLLMAFRFIPGTTVTAVVALMIMHVVVIATAVPAYALASHTTH